jgi:hypothetical protein
VQEWEMRRDKKNANERKKKIEPLKNFLVLFFSQSHSHDKTVAAVDNTVFAVFSAFTFS